MVEALFAFLEAHTILAPVIFILVRSLALIIPPIPGIVLDIPAILLFGWFPGFLYSEAGVMLGTMVSFWLARKLREPVLKKFVSLQKIHEWEDKLSGAQQFWGFTLLRVATGPFFDYISYAAGLTRFSTKKFFWSSLLVTLPSSFLVYFFGGIAFGAGAYYGAGFFIVLAVVLFWFSKGIVVSKKK